MLCLHGITGTPYEVRPIAEALAGAGCSVESPMLAGHGRTLRELAVTEWPDWLASAEQAMDALAARTGERRLAVVGFSMGGLLALRLARLYPDRVAALVVIAAPLRLRAFQVRGVRALARLPFDFRKLPFAAVPKLNGSDVSDPVVRFENPGLRAFPIAAVNSLLDLMDVVRADLPAITAPALVVHGRLDHTVPIDDSLELTSSLGSPVVERLWLDRSFHIVTRDVEGALVVDAITKFLARHAGW